MLGTQPISSPPDAEILQKAKTLAALADRINADAAPMSLVALRCQEGRPDLTLRFINDAHLNQTMAYLTACTLYAAVFHRSPQGLPIDSVTDIRYWQKQDGKFDKTKDRDGKPITLQLSAKDRDDLQRIAWKGYSQFSNMREKRRKAEGRR